MEGLGLLRDGWTVIVLRRRVAACKASEHNQSEERLIGPHDVPLPEFAYWLCIRACLSVNDRNTQFYGQARRAPLGHLGRIGFDLMLASLAPNDRPNAGGGSVDERHRRAGLGLHRAQRADSVDVAMINVTVISYRPSAHQQDGTARVGKHHSTNSLEVSNQSHADFIASSMVWRRYS
jgi:hypothetical protein